MINIDSSRIALLTTLGIIMVCFGTMILAAAESDTNNMNNNVNIEVNKVIKEGLQECSELQNDSCYGVMHTLDNICQVAYYDSCFGDKWTKFNDYITEQIKEGHYPDEAYKEDPYFTLNNHHKGARF